MFSDIKKIEEAKICECITICKEIEALEAKKRSYSLPIKTFNFWQRHITKRKEYQDLMKKAQENKEHFDEVSKKIDELKGKIKTEVMRRLGTFSYSVDKFDELLEGVRKATTFQELGYFSAEEVKMCLEDNGMPIRFDSVQEGLEMFQEIACRDVEFMLRAVDKDFRNVGYDKTDDKRVYVLYLNRKLPILETKLAELKGKNPEEYQEIGELGWEIETLQEYYEELAMPQKVESGKYKVPHKFMFEELRNVEKPENRENSGNAYTDSYKYLKVDGKFPIEYGKKLEEIYTREDIVFGVHGTTNTNVSEYLTRGLKESISYGRARQADNTVLYGRYLTFTNALEYGKVFGSNTVFVLGLPKNAFSKANPEYIWGSCEKDGAKYILPEYVLGYYEQGDEETREFTENEELARQQYRYLYQDATVDPVNSNVIDTENFQR